MSEQDDWKDRVKAVASAESAVEQNHPLRRTIDELVATLNESPWLAAELAPGPFPQILQLVVRPKYRRDIRVSMINFWFAARSVIVMGGERQEFASEDELQQFLVDFVEKTQFPTTVAEFRMMHDQDVHGALRLRGLLEDDADDVPVLVDARSHDRLAKQTIEGRSDVPIEVDVALEERPGMGSYDPSRRYLCLESGGFGVRVQSIQPVGERVLRIIGDIVPLADLPA